MGVGVGALSASFPEDAMTLCLGIDVSKATLDVAGRSEGRVAAEQTQVIANTTAALDALIQRLHGVRPELIVLEATGGYERLAVSMLAAAGLPVIVVNPKQVRSRSAPSPRRRANSRRPTDSMRRCWRCLRSASAPRCGRCGPRRRRR